MIALKIGNFLNKKSQELKYNDFNHWLDSANWETQEETIISWIEEYCQTIRNPLSTDLNTIIENLPYQMDDDNEKWYTKEQIIEVVNTILSSEEQSHLGCLLSDYERKLEKVVDKIRIQPTTLEAIGVLREFDEIQNTVADSQCFPMRNYDDAQTLDISDVNASFKDAAQLLKETITLMTFKYLFNTKPSEERQKDEEWLKGVSKVVKWMENHVPK